MIWNDVLLGMFSVAFTAGMMGKKFDTAGSVVTDRSARFKAAMSERWSSAEVMRTCPLGHSCRFI